MTMLSRIGALDIAEAISTRIGSYVDMNFIQFLAVDRDRVMCWYMNCDGDGPTFEIVLARTAAGWTLDLTEYPPGTEQQVELP
jgi:hypothetical protein